jgi:hypothetical protein
MFPIPSPAPIADHHADAASAVMLQDCEAGAGAAKGLDQARPAGGAAGADHLPDVGGRPADRGQNPGRWG